MPQMKKPAGTAVDARNGAKLVLLPSPPTVVPPCPPGLLKSTRERWDAYWHDAVSGLIQPSEVGLVEQWITLTDEWHRSMAAFKRTRIVTGSTGQPALNPLSKWIQQTGSAITVIEDRLGLSPKARIAIGVAVGAAQKSLADMNAALEEAPDDDDASAAYVTVDVAAVPDARADRGAVDPEVPGPLSG